MRLDGGSLGNAACMEKQSFNWLRDRQGKESIGTCGAETKRRTNDGRMGRGGERLSIMWHADMT